MERTYEQGLRDAQHEALRAVQKAHEERLNLHSVRLGRLERWFAMLAGIILALQLIPSLKSAFDAFN